MNSPELEMRPLKASDFAGLRSLFRRVWNEERDERHDRMRFQSTSDGLPVAQVALLGDECVGYFMLWPIELFDGRRIIKAGQAMDVMTDDRCRGKGVFPELAHAALQSAAKRGMQLVFGAPNRAIFQSYLTRLSWAQPTEIRTFVRPVSFSGIAPFSAAADSLLAILRRVKIAAVSIGHERPSDEALGECLTASTVGAGVWRVHRTPAWYDFRLQPTGKSSFQWCSVWRGDTLVAFSIVGLIVATKGRAVRANLADVVGVDEESRRIAVALALDAARKAGASYVVAILTSRNRMATLRANGFISYRRAPLIARTLDADRFAANPFLKTGWDLFGADFDFI